MGVRPPTSDSKEPETVTFGIAALDARLDESSLTFPARADEIVAELDDPAIPYDGAGHTVRLSEAFDRTHLQHFESRQELLNALHPVFESFRERAGNGLLAQLRNLVPF